ncbi:hypothetical protein ES703_120854 [subsurface metagenome]
MNFFPWGGQGYNEEIRLFPEPLVFMPGEEVTVEMQMVFANGGAGAAKAYLLGLIEKVEAI